LDFLITGKAKQTRLMGGGPKHRKMVYCSWCDRVFCTRSGAIGCSCSNRIVEVKWVTADAPGAVDFCDCADEFASERMIAELRGVRDETLTTANALTHWAPCEPDKTVQRPPKDTRERQRCKRLGVAARLAYLLGS